MQPQSSSVTLTDSSSCHQLARDWQWELLPAGKPATPLGGAALFFLLLLAGGGVMLMGEAIPFQTKVGQTSTFDDAAAEPVKSRYIRPFGCETLYRTPGGLLILLFEKPHNRLGDGEEPQVREVDPDEAIAWLERHKQDVPLWLGKGLAEIRLGGKREQHLTPVPSSLPQPEPQSMRNHGSQYRSAMAR